MNGSTRPCLGCGTEKLPNDLCPNCSDGNLVGGAEVPGAGLVVYTLATDDSDPSELELGCPVG